MAGSERICSVEVSKPHALCHHLVQIGGADRRLRVSAEMALARVARKDQHEVRVPRRHDKFGPNHQGHEMDSRQTEPVKEP